MVYKTLKYLSPVSGRIATIILSLFSDFLEYSIAVYTAAPDEIPHKIPSSFAQRRAVSIASSFDTVKISSTVFLSKFSGIKLAPIP